VTFNEVASQIKNLGGRKESGSPGGGDDNDGGGYATPG
jgi:hypothetical protein